MDLYLLEVRMISEHSPRVPQCYLIDAAGRSLRGLVAGWRTQYFVDSVWRPDDEDLSYFGMDALLKAAHYAILHPGPWRREYRLPVEGWR